VCEARLLDLVIPKVSREYHQLTTLPRFSLYTPYFFFALMIVWPSTARDCNPGVIKISRKRRAKLKYVVLFVVVVVLN
jgi:hypothetical protein